MSETAKCWVCSIDMTPTAERTQVCRDCRHTGILYGNDRGITVRRHRSGFEIVQDGTFSARRVALIGTSFGLDAAIERAEQL